MLNNVFKLQSYKIHFQMKLGEFHTLPLGVQYST